MKKTFEEPEVRKILINLRESIADGSGGPDNYVSIIFATVQAMAGCTDLITDTLPNPGIITGDILVEWININAAALATCSTIGVEPGGGIGTFSMAPTRSGKGTVVYDVPKDIADAYGMRY